MVKNKTEDCILCFPAPCECGRKPKQRKAVKSVSLPQEETTFVVPEKTDEDLIQEYALTNLRGLLHPDHAHEIAAMLPDELTPAHHAAAWRGRRL